MLTYFYEERLMEKPAVIFLKLMKIKTGMNQVISICFTSIYMSILCSSRWERKNNNDESMCMK